MKISNNNLLKYGTYFLIFLLPLLYFGNLVYPYVTSKTFFLYGVVELLFCVWLYTIYVDKSYRLTKKQLIFFIPIVLYILWMTLAGIFAINPRLAFWSSLGRGTGLITLYHLLALSLIIASLTRRHGLSYVENFFKWCLFGSFILALSVWSGTLGFDLPFEFLRNDTGGGLGGNSSLTASYLLFSLFFGLYLLLVKKINLKQKILISIILITIILSPLFIRVYGLLSEFSFKALVGDARGSFLGIIVGFSFFVITYLIFSKEKIKRIIGIILIIVSLTIFSVGWIKLMNPDTKLHQKFTEVALGTRFIFWDIAEREMNTHPYLGSGPENYGIVFEKDFNPIILKKEYRSENWNDKAHNIYFDNGVSGGYPAIVLYVFFIGTLIYALYRINKNKIFSNKQTAIFLGLMVGYLFQDLFYFDSILSLFALFSLMGVIYGSISINEIEEDSYLTKINNSKKIFVFISLALLFIILFTNFCYLPLKKANAISKIKELSLYERPIYYPKLIGISPVGDDVDIGIFASEFYLKYSDYFRNGFNKENLSYFKKDIEAYLLYLDQISQKNKNNYLLYLNQLNLYNLDLYIDRAQTSDQKLIKKISQIINQAKILSPNNPETYFSTATFYLRLNNMPLVINELQEAIKLDSTNPDAWKVMLNFIKNTGDKEFYNKTLIEARNHIVNFTE